MRRPFVLRVQADDPAAARAIARALVTPLRERGARVLLDGATLGGGKGCLVHLLSAARSAPGVSLVVGLWDEDEGARWLAPLDLPTQPDVAARETMAFLQTWGFVSAPHVAAEPRRS